jgi:molybdopterin converting factor small subunit
VWSSLVSEFPELSAYETSISCAVNEDYSRFTASVADGDEIAFLPPVSGG